MATSEAYLLAPTTGGPVVSNRPTAVPCLDEIGDMPLELQTRLLRVLADGEFYPVGAHSPVQVDVRVVTATHQNLEQLVAEGRFREDLFDRFNGIRVQMPPLRERHEDIPLLLEHYRRKATEMLNEQPKR